MIHSIHPEAEAEFKAAADFYDEREEGLGEIFSAEVFATIDRIIDFPNSWPRSSHLFTARTRFSISKPLPSRA